MDFFTVTIPFYSKNWIKNKNNSHKMNGNAIYKFNLKTYEVTSYFKLFNCTYKASDLLSTTQYYKNKKVKKFRSTLLDHFNTPIKNHFYTLTKSQLKEVNDYLKEDATATLKTQYSYFIGCNISGGETKQKNSPIRCNETIYIGYNFLNVFDNFRKKFYLNNIPKKENYSLKEILSKNIVTGLIEKFHAVNKCYYLKTEFKNSEFKDRTSEFVIKIMRDSNFYPKTKTTDASIKEEIREFYVKQVKIFISLGFIENKILFIQNSSEQIQRAHIISVKKLVEINTFDSLSKAVDPYNCLHIDANSHLSFDAKKFYFNSNGDKVYKDNHQEKFIDKSKLTNQQLQYMEDYEKDFKLDLK